MLANGTVELNCTAVGNQLFWEKNGKPLTDGSNGVIIKTKALNNALNIRMSTLRVPVTDDAPANFTCTAVITDSLHSAVSEPAVVLKQGNL